MKTYELSVPLHSRWIYWMDIMNWNKRGQPRYPKLPNSTIYNKDWIKFKGTLYLKRYWWVKFADFIWTTGPKPIISERVKNFIEKEKLMRFFKK